MQLIKLRLLKERVRPIIRITYKTFWGKEVQRDVIQLFSQHNEYWRFVDNGTSVPHKFCAALAVFEENGLKEYELNITEL